VKDRVRRTIGIRKSPEISKPPKRGEGEGGKMFENADSIPWNHLTRKVKGVPS